MEKGNDVKEEIQDILALTLARAAAIVYGQVLSNEEIETGRKSVLPSYKIGFSLKQKHTVLKTCRNIRIIRRISFFRNMFINTINHIFKG